MSPMPSREAKTITEPFFEELILIYGAPKNICSDSGTELKNEVINELNEMCNKK